MDRSAEWIEVVSELKIGTRLGTNVTFSVPELYLALFSELKKS